jgi:C4-dicarboxylate-specific signal transduction histidine kinase
MATVNATGHAEDLFVMGDMASATAIVVNLLSNALDAVAGMRQPVVTLSCTRAGGMVAMEIRDHGEGLDTEALPHLFRPWFTTKGADKGLGLGLALSKEIAEKMGGRLAGGNHPEGGAVFSLSLPAAMRLAQAAAPLPLAQPVHETPKLAANA